MGSLMSGRSRRSRRLISNAHRSQRPRRLRRRRRRCRLRRYFLLLLLLSVHVIVVAVAPCAANMVVVRISPPLCDEGSLQRDCSSDDVLGNG